MSKNRKKRGNPGPQRQPAHGFPLENLEGASLHLVFEKLAGKSRPRGARKQRVAALRELLQDGDRWDAWLADLPTLSLIALEIIVEAQGGLELADLEEILQARTSCDEEAAYFAGEQLIAHYLVVPLGDRDGLEPTALSIYEETLPLLEERLRGVSLPALPEELAAASAASTSDSTLCRTLAVAGLTAHRRLRFTRSGAPDRTTLKRFAKNLGASQNEVFDLAERAMDTGLVRAYGESLLPSPRRMLELSRGGGDASSFESWLEPGVWVSLEGLVRACVRAKLGTRSGGAPERGSANVLAGIAPLFSYFEQWARGANGLEHRTVAGIAWVRRPIQPEVLTGDGHVTPNFEIMLGPAAHPEIVATVALGCELQRIDRVLTFRITPESVAQGKAAGLAEGQLRAALDRVGRHPLAENVAQLVGEWEQACSVARVANGWFLFADSELQSVLEEGELQPYLLGSPVPGVLELDPATPRRHIEAALAEHRVRLSLSYPLANAEAQREASKLAAPSLDDLDDEWENPWDDGFDETESLAGLERPWSLEPAGAPVLRERLVLGRESGFAVELPSRPAPVPLPQEIGDHLTELRRRLVPLDREATRELARFRRKLSKADRTIFDGVRAIGIPLSPFLALKPKWRRRVVHAAENLDELLDFSLENIEHGRCTSAGERLLALLDDPAIVAAMQAEADSMEPPRPSYTFATSNTFDGPRRPSPPESQPEPLPAVDAFPELEPHELLLRLSQAAKHQRSIYALVDSDVGPQVHALHVDRIEIQGSRQVLLAEDLDSGEGRVVHVRSIRSLLM